MPGQRLSRKVFVYLLVHLLLHLLVHFLVKLLVHHQVVLIVMIMVIVMLVILPSQPRLSGLGCDDGDGDGGNSDGDGPLPRPSSSVPSGLSSRGGTRETPSEASYYQAAPTKEAPLQLPRASPSQKLPEAPWPTNPQPPTLISAPLKPQSHPINSTSSQLERSTEGSIHSTNGVSLHANATSQQQGRGLSSSSTQRPENLSSQPPQANNGKSKVGKFFLNPQIIFMEHKSSDSFPTELNEYL